MNGRSHSERVVAMTPSVQKCAVGPLVRLGVSPILYALLGRPKVLAATRARMHSSGDAVCSDHLYTREASRIATSAGTEKVSRRVGRGADFTGRPLIVIAAAITVMSLTLRMLRTPHPCHTEAPVVKRINMTVRNGDSLLGEIWRVWLECCMELLA